MPAADLLLRLMLAFALLVNGLPSAMAGDMPAAQEAVGTADGGGCHEMAATTGQAPAGETASTDCCNGEDCSCTCLHHAPMLAARVSALPAPPFAQSADVAAVPGMSGRQPAPSLRPPIA